MAFQFATKQNGNWSNPLVWHNQLTSIAINSAAKTLIVDIGPDGNADEFPTPGTIVRVIGSTGNDADYTVVAASYSNPNLTLTFAETPPVNSSDGTAYSTTLPQVSSDYTSTYVTVGNHNIVVDIAITFFEGNLILQSNSEGALTFLNDAYAGDLSFIKLDVGSRLAGSGVTGAGIACQVTPGVGEGIAYITNIKLTTLRTYAPTHALDYGFNINDAAINELELRDPLDVGANCQFTLGNTTITTITDWASSFPYIGTYTFNCAAGVNLGDITAAYMKFVINGDTSGTTTAGSIAVLSEAVMTLMTDVHCTGSLSVSNFAQNYWSSACSCSSGWLSGAKLQALYGAGIMSIAGNLDLQGYSELTTDSGTATFNVGGNLLVPYSGVTVTRILFTIGGLATIAVFDTTAYTGTVFNMKRPTGWTVGDNAVNYVGPAGVHNIIGIGI